MENKSQKEFKKLPFYTSAAAAVVVLIACIIMRAHLFWMAIWVSLSIVLFFVIGEFIRFFIVTQVFPPEPEQDDFLEYDDEDHVEDSDDVEEPLDIDEEDDEENDDSEVQNEPVEDSFLDE